MVGTWGSGEYTDRAEGRGEEAGGNRYHRLRRDVGGLILWMCSAARSASC